MIPGKARRYRRVERRSTRGHLYWYWVRTSDVPPIPQRYLDSVVYLYESPGAAEAGEDIGGTGFLAEVPRGGELPGSLYVVTNDHVAKEAAAVRLNTKAGTTDVLPLEGGQWKAHPDGDDLAVYPMGLTPDYRFSAISWEHFAQEENFGGVSPGDDVFFLGRFITHEGRQQNYPSVRFGHVAMLPWEKIWIGERQVWQEGFLGEVLSVSGYSGSPVIVFKMHWIATYGGGRSHLGPPGADTSEESEPLLLGVDCAHLTAPARVKQPGGTSVSDKTYVDQNTGMAVVVPAWKLRDLLADEELEEMRQSETEELKNQVASGGVVLDSASAGCSEFDEFEDLTRKLVNVPKKEVDEQRRAEES